MFSIFWGKQKMFYKINRRLADGLLKERFLFDCFKYLLSFCNVL